MAWQGAIEKLEPMKGLFIEELETEGHLLNACIKFHTNTATVKRWAERDPDIQAAIETAKYVREIKNEALLDDIADNPEKYDKPLTRPAWASLIMFRQKYLNNGYRENATKLEVNIGQVSTKDTEDIAAAYWKAKEAEAKQVN